jgi:hypothetical protein
VAKLLADACAEHIAIERNLTEIKEAGRAGARQVNGPAAHAKSAASLSGTKELSDKGLEGATA